MAIAVSRVGERATLAGKRRDDEFGWMLAGILEDVNGEGVAFDIGARTALAFVTLKHSGEREFMFYQNPSADMLLTPGELNLDLIKLLSPYAVGWLDPVVIFYSKIASPGSTLNTSTFLHQNDRILLIQTRTDRYTKATERKRLAFPDPPAAAAACQLHLRLTLAPAHHRSPAPCCLRSLTGGGRGALPSPAQPAFNIHYSPLLLLCLFSTESRRTVG